MLTYSDSNNSFVYLNFKVQNITILTTAWVRYLCYPRSVTLNFIHATHVSGSKP